MTTAVFAITSGGGVIRTATRPDPKGRTPNQGRSLDEPGRGRHTVSIARNAEEQDSAAEASDADTRIGRNVAWLRATGKWW